METVEKYSLGQKEGRSNKEADKIALLSVLLLCKNLWFDNTQFSGELLTQTLSSFPVFQVINIPFFSLEMSRTYGSKTPNCLFVGHTVPTHQMWNVHLYNN